MLLRDEHNRFRDHEDDLFSSAPYNLKRVQHPVHLLIDACVHNVADMAAHADIGLDVAGDLEALPNVHVDAIAAEHALTNLLRQAITVAPRGGSVGLSVWSADGHVMFAIRHAGQGISETGIRQLDAMDANEAMESLRTQPHEGIALPLSKALVGMHGGHFHIESNEQAGTTVTFSFPCPARVEIPAA